MSAFTGGCIYAWDCEKFISTCKDCTQLPASKFDLAYDAQKLKHDLFKNKNLHLAANSFWMEDEARKSFIFKNISSLRTIHIPIDTSVFKPLDKNLCRDIIGADADDFVICFGATYLSSKRKGLLLLLKALQVVYSKYKKIKCVVYGNNFPLTEQPACLHLFQ
jgi:glycosyltransferase involved in cell wall biosynthesis